MEMGVSIDVSGLVEEQRLIISIYCHSFLAVDGSYMAHLARIDESTHWQRNLPRFSFDPSINLSVLCWLPGASSFVRAIPSPSVNPESEYGV